MSYSVPYSFIPGTKARAQEINANFNALTGYCDTFENSKADIDLSNLTANGIATIKNNTSLRNLGEIIYSLIPISDVGLHLLDGTLISYEGIYKKFVEKIASMYTQNPNANYFTTENDWQTEVSTYGECAKFVYNDSNNTVRLPKIEGIMEVTNKLEDLGELTEAGLPNITAATTKTGLGIKNTAATFSGAFQGSVSGSSNTVQGGSDNTHGLFNGQLKFDASKSSSIYGNSETVQPQTVKCFAYIVIATVAKTDIQVDIDEIATDLNGKMDTDLSNMSASQTGKNTIINWGMPDYSSAISITTCPTSSSPYSAPDYGIFIVTGDWTSSTSVYVNSNNLNLSFYEDVSGVVVQEIVLLLSKNDEIYFTNSSYSTTFKAAFIPLKGVN